MALTATAVRNAKSSRNLRKLSDSDVPFLLVTPKGAGGGAWTTATPRCARRSHLASTRTWT